MPNARMPPANENNGEKAPSAGAKAVTSTATNPDPALIPMMPGSASGLRMTACVMTPATAIAMPPKMDEPIARRAMAPAPTAVTNGKKPNSEEIAVIIMARNRI